MDNKIFKGILPALITPFNENGALKEQTVRDLIDWQLSKGVKGFYICGSTGEGPAISEETRMRMAEVTMNHVKGRAQVICHVAAADALSAIRLAKHAASVGCDAVASVPPAFYYSYSDDETFGYYKALNDATDLPLMSYATGMFKQADISPFIGKLMTLPHAIGVKFTRNNYYEMRRVIELNGGNINVINGPDEMLICGLSMGADAGIGSTYNLMADRYVKLFNLFTAGDYKAACALQYEINHVIAVMIDYGVMPSIKHALDVLGFDAGYTAFPGKHFLAEEAQAFERDMKAAGYTFTR